MFDGKYKRIREKIYSHSPARGDSTLLYIEISRSRMLFQIIRNLHSCLQANTFRAGGDFFRRYYISQSQNTVGMVRMELEAIDE